MARLREPAAPKAAPERPAWLKQFRWQDWDDPEAPTPLFSATGGLTGGSQTDPVEDAWIRRALAARHRWNKARIEWFREHGEHMDRYRVRLTGRTLNDLPDDAPQEIDE